MTVIERPNIVFIMPDQLRADFLSCYGAGFIRTPHIDSLGERGVRYARAVSPSPLCVPARAALLTGLNALKTGVLGNDQWLRPDHEACGIETWPQLLTGAGYRTGAIGKMHFYPWDAGEGFQERAIAEDKRHIAVRDDYYRYLQEHGHRKYHGAEHEGYFEHKGAVVSRIPAEHQVDVWVADQACAFIERHRGDGRPFALMVGFPGPHDPYDPPPELAGLFDPAAMPPSIPPTEDSRKGRAGFIASHLQEWNQVDYTEFTEAHKRKVRAYYAALVHQIDRGVGRILATLRRMGYDDNTVVLFASDHGDMLGDFDLMGKNSFYETSIRVPLLVRHPCLHAGRIEAGTVSLTDVYATILRLAGVRGLDSPDSVPLPGFGREDEPPRDYVFGVLGKGAMVTDDRWKYVRTGGDVQLFDRRDDPHEQRNLASVPGYEETLRRLDRLLQAELWAGIVAGHADKIAIAATDEPTYGLPGWRRTYPHPVPGGGR